MNFIYQINYLVCSGITRSKSRLVFGDKVMCSKVSVTIVENNFFKYFTTNRKERYRSIIFNKLFITFFEYWSYISKFPNIGIYSS